MARYVGIIDDAKIGVQADKDTESVAYGEEIYLDLISIEWTVDNEMEARATVGGGVKYNTLIPKTAKVSGSLKGRIVDGRALAWPLGTLAAGGGPPDWVASIDTALDYYSIQVQLSATEYAKLLGVKFDGFSITCSIGGALEISMDFKALEFIIATGAVSGTHPTELPFEYYHGVVAWDLVTTDIINDFTINFTRNTEAKRGIETSIATEKRLATEIIEKMAEISLDMTVAVQDTVIVRDALGEPGADIGDTIASIACEITFTRDATNILIFNLSDCKMKSVGGGVFEETDERTWSFSGQALDLDLEISVT